MYGGFPNKNLFINSVPRKKINKLSLNGRSSLAMIIIAKKIKKIYIPFYICEEVVKTIKKMNVEYEFYSINKNLKPKFKYNSLIKNKDYYILLIPYFGVVNLGSQWIKDKAIYDLSNAFYYKRYKLIYFFDSIRKFFHVNFGSNLNQDCFIDGYNKKKKKLLFYKPKNYEDFRLNEKKHYICLQNVNKIISKDYFRINFYKIRKYREKNFYFLHYYLKKKNKLKFFIKDIRGPLYYPYLINSGGDLRIYLNNKKIYNPNLWKEALNRKKINYFSFEKKLIKDLVLLPIDEKIKTDDLIQIKNIIYQYEQKR